ncbi:MAG: hypothetical protein HC854_03310 [Flavobacterium sp.]|nr:hypothetical protein [Flavobacterium sp.]
MRSDNDKIKTKLDILSSMGIDANRTNASEMFNQYIKKQFVIEGVEASENKEAYLIDIKKRASCC